MTEEKLRKLDDFLEKAYRARELMRELEFKIDNLKNMGDGREVRIGDCMYSSVALPEHIAQPVIQQAIEWYQQQYDAEIAIFDKTEFEV